MRGLLKDITAALSSSGLKDLEAKATISEVLAAFSRYNDNLLNEDAEFVQ
jgi:hypothetical protein